VLVSRSTGGDFSGDLGDIELTSSCAGEAGEAGDLASSGPALSNEESESIL
jgi:hypothetical protein